MVLISLGGVDTLFFSGTRDCKDCDLIDTSTCWRINSLQSVFLFVEKKIVGDAEKCGAWRSVFMHRVGAGKHTKCVFYKPIMACGLVSQVIMPTRLINSWT